MFLARIPPFLPSRHSELDSESRSFLPSRHPDVLLVRITVFLPHVMTGLREKRGQTSGARQSPFSRSSSFPSCRTLIRHLILTNKPHYGSRSTKFMRVQVRTSELCFHPTMVLAQQPLLKKLYRITGNKVKSSISIRAVSIVKFSGLYHVLCHDTVHQNRPQVFYR